MHMPDGICGQLRVCLYKFRLNGGYTQSAAKKSLSYEAAFNLLHAVPLLQRVTFQKQLSKRLLKQVKIQ